MINANLAGVKSQPVASVGVLQFLLDRLFRPAHVVINAAPARALARMAEAGTEMSWTASLSRGDDMPPFRLSILTAHDARSSIRIEPLSSPVAIDSTAR